jgi:serine/threonine-protein kinase
LIIWSVAVFVLIAGLFLFFSRDVFFNSFDINPVSSQKNEIKKNNDDDKKVSNSDKGLSNKELLPVPNLITDYGKLFVECSPWGDVYVDNVKIDTTPLKDYIRLKPGRHTIKVIHPDYPSYVKNIRIAGAQIETIVIDFKYSVGYLMCNINPWGNVYINGELKGTTPLRSPILLYPGSYTLTVANPQYGKKEVIIDVKARDTLNYNFNFETQDSVKNNL